MAQSNSMQPLEDLVPYAAADWASGDLSLKNAAGDCARYLKVVSVGASPSLVLLLENGQTRTYTAANSVMAAAWETRHGLRVAAIKQATADVTAVLVGW